LLEQSDKQVIIAVTGPFGSGTSTAAEIIRDKILNEQGCQYIRIRDLISDWLLGLEGKKWKADSTYAAVTDLNSRPLLQAAGDEMRRLHGDDSLVNEAIDKANKLAGGFPPILIDCVKTVAEVMKVRERRYGYVLAVITDRETRWKRVESKYAGDRIQFDQDDERDKEERNNPHGQFVRRCVELADVQIYSGTHITLSVSERKELTERLRGYVGLLRNPGSRPPGHGELHMNNAFNISLRSNCLRRHVGAVATITRRKPRSSDELIEDEEFREQPRGDKDVLYEEFVIAATSNRTPIGINTCKAEYDRCYREIEKEKGVKDFSYCPGCGEKIVDSVAKGGLTCPSCHVELVKYIPGKALDLCRVLHAEEAAILQVARLGGVPLENATLYTTCSPCQLCAKKLIQAGFRRVIWMEPYPHGDALKMLDDAGVRVEAFEGVVGHGFYRLFASTNWL
jgi:deoxycytidylate deaminase